MLVFKKFTFFHSVFFNKKSSPIRATFIYNILRLVVISSCVKNLIKKLPYTNGPGETGKGSNSFWQHFLLFYSIFCKSNKSSRSFTSVRECEGVCSFSCIVFIGFIFVCKIFRVIIVSFYNLEKNNLQVVFQSNDLGIGR